MADSATTLERIGAVARRDLKVQLSYHFEFAMRYVGIAFSIATFFFLSRLVGDAPELGAYSGRYFDFALVGLIMTGLTMLSLSAFNRAISAEMGGGTFEILLASPVPLATYLLGALLTPLALRVVDMAIFLLVGIALLGAGFTVNGLLASLPLLVLSIAVFSALGIMSAAFVVLTKRGDPVTNLVVQTTNLLAGTLFPIAVLPGYLQALSKLIPTFYALRGIRAALLEGGGLAETLDEVLILGGFIVVLVPTALWLFRYAVRMAKRTGTLGNY